MGLFEFPSERKREQILLNLLLLVIISSIIQALFLFQTNDKLVIKLSYFLLVMFGSIPFAVLFEFILVALAGGNVWKKLFIQSPTECVEAPVTVDTETWFDDCMERLIQLEFEIDEIDSSSWQIYKKKSKETHGFISGHNFEGNLQLQQREGTLTAVLQLTFKDLVVIETGEYDSLRQLGLYILGEVKAHQTQEIPLTLMCAIYLSVIANILTYLVLMNIMSYTLCIQMLMGSLFMSVWMFFMILSNPEFLIGKRLAFLNIIICLIPLMTKAIQMVTT